MDRAANILKAPYAKLGECPYCQGTEWATTEAMIGAERPVVGRGLQLWLISAVLTAVLVGLCVIAAGMRGLI